MTRRLVHVTTTDMRLDRLLRPQLEAFLHAGYEVIGVSAPGPNVDPLRAAGIDHVAVPALTPSTAPWRDAVAFGQLMSAFRRLRPDIVHTHDPKPGVLGRLAARAAGVPVVVNTVHALPATSDDGFLKRSLLYGLERLAASCSDTELLQNADDLPVLRRLGVPHERLTVLGDGIDLRRFDPHRAAGRRARIRTELGVAPETVVVGVVGRLVWENGFGAVFEAAERLDDVDCVIVVAGPDEPDTRGAVGPEALAPAAAAGARFLGQRDDMEDLYAAFDVYVLASHRDGYPRSAMEAAAMGLPIVATDMRGGRRVVADGVNGSLVPVDDGAALAAAVERLVDDPALRVEQGEAGRVRARDHFDVRRVVDITVGTYDLLLGHRAVDLVTAPGAS